MNKPIFRILAGINIGFIMLIVFSCQKDTQYDVLSGRVIGKIILIEDQYILSSDQSGIEVTFEGSHPEKKTYSDGEGQYEIPDLPSGIYNIIFKKEGICTHKIIGYQHVGGSKPYRIPSTRLYKVNDIHIDSLKLTIIDEFFDKKIIGTIQLNKYPKYSYFRYFLAKTSDVSYKNYLTTDITDIYSRDGSYQFGIFQIDSVKFPAGSNAFMIIYPISENEQKYVDINTGLYIYSTVNVDNGSPVASLVVPDFNVLKSN